MRKTKAAAAIATLVSLASTAGHMKGW